MLMASNSYVIPQKGRVAVLGAFQFGVIIQH
jgi:hypothetical protein